MARGPSVQVPPVLPVPNRLLQTCCFSSMFWDPQNTAPHLLPQPLCWDLWTPLSWAPASASATPQLPPRPGRSLTPLGRRWCCGDKDRHGDAAGKGTPLATCSVSGHLPSASSQVAFVPPERILRDPRGMHSTCKVESWGELRRVHLHCSHPSWGFTPVTWGNTFPFPSAITTVRC